MVPLVEWADSQFDQLAEATRRTASSEVLAFESVDQAGMPEPRKGEAIAARLAWRKRRFATTWAQCVFDSTDDFAALRVAAGAAVGMLPRRGVDPLNEARMLLPEEMRAECVRLRQDALASARSRFELVSAVAYPDAVGLDLSSEEVFYREVSCSIKRLVEGVSDAGLYPRATDDRHFTSLLTSRSGDVQLLVLPRSPSSFYSGVPLDMSVAAYLGLRSQGGDVRRWRWVDLVSLAPSLEYVCMVRTVPGFRACAEVQWELIRNIASRAADLAW